MLFTKRIPQYLLIGSFLVCVFLIKDPVHAMPGEGVYTSGYRSMNTLIFQMLLEALVIVSTGYSVFYLIQTPKKFQFKLPLIVLGGIVVISMLVLVWQGVNDFTGPTYGSGHFSPFIWIFSGGFLLFSILLGITSQWIWMQGNYTKVNNALLVLLVVVLLMFIVFNPHLSGLVSIVGISFIFVALIYGIVALKEGKESVYMGACKLIALILIFGLIISIYHTKRQDRKLKNHFYNNCILVQPREDPAYLDKNWWQTCQSGGQRKERVLEREHGYELRISKANIQDRGSQRADDKERLDELVRFNWTDREITLLLTYFALFYVLVPFSPPSIDKKKQYIQMQQQ